MKTKIRSLIIICTLGLVGVLNANATSSYKTSCIDGALKEQNITKSENLNLTGFVFNADADAAIDYQTEAQSVTKWIADNKEAETIQMLIDKGIILSNEEAANFVCEVKSENQNSAEFEFNAATEIDYQKEAQLVTKWIADNEEAETIQMLIDKGIILSDKDAATFACEAKSENLNSAEFEFNAETEIDYQKEANW